MTKTPDQTITLSVETDKETFVHGFHLGTEEKLARRLAEEFFLYRILPEHRGTYIRSVALIRDGKLVATFDGEWDRPEV